jgi:monoamine oxidase
MARGKGEHHSVVVIGGGVAGLAAARRLFQAGVDVVLLEARDDLGGRIRTSFELAPFPVELGAEFVHGRPPQLLAEICAARLHLDEQAFDPLLLDHGRILNVASSWEELFAELRRRPPRDVPFGARIKRLEGTRRWTRREAQLARQYVEGYMAADVERVSAQALSQETSASEKIHGDRAYRLREGYAGLVSSLARDLPKSMLRFASAVRRIRWRSGSVVVESSGPTGFARESIHAERAIVTLPLGVWQQPPGDPGQIAFEPDPAKESCAARLGMGSVTKILFRLRGPLSSASGVSRPLRTALRGTTFFLVRGAPVPTWWTVGPDDEPILVGWSAGAAALNLSSKPRPQALGIAARTLSDALGTSERAISELVESAHIVDWHEDPFARGAYSWVPAGALDAARELASPVGGTLFFAGEATDTEGYRGTVHGAFLTGIRAAAEVLRAA